MWTHWPTAEEESRYLGLQDLVRKFMTHRHTPQCKRSDGSCRWNFPLPPVPHTVQLSNGQWRTHRGPADGWITAYHPGILLRFRGHANYNCTNGTATIGYLLGYPFKGDSTIRASLAEVADADEPRDEIRQFQTLRVVSSSEAVFRLLEYPIAMVTPAVHDIKVLLDDQKFVYVRPGQSAAEARQRYHTDVEKWFARPATCERASFRKYFEEYMVTDTEPRRVAHIRDAFGNCVYRRQRGGDVLVHVASAKINTPQWHARLLLLQPDCLARSWEAVRTHLGTVHASFAGAPLLLLLFLLQILHIFKDAEHDCLTPFALTNHFFYLTCLTFNPSLPFAQAAM
jgi:hypothetical protein